MGITVTELLKIAAAQVGYREKETNSQLDNPTANAGDGNYTKFAVDLHKAGYYNGNKNGYAWCDVFVDWCFWKLCGGDAAKAQKVQCQIGPYGAGCSWSARYFKEAGRLFTSNPQPGDQAFFKDYAHTGIVEKVTDTTIVIIEGNAGNAVQRNPYARNDARLISYGRPLFEAEKPAPSPVPTKSVEEVARECIKGDWGNGNARRDKLTAAGYDYRTVQAKVNELLTIDRLARECIRGDWGNGEERRKRLTAAGYDYAAVQKRVNELI